MSETKDSTQPELPLFAVTLAKRQTPSSRFSHFEGSWEELVAMVQEQWRDGQLSETISEPWPDNPGVKKVVLDPARFKSGVVKLERGAKLWGQYEGRVAAEAPRKSIWGYGEKIQAEYVEVILYHRDLLEADPHYGDPSAEWEIISINASPEETPCPIDPWTLCYNYFELSGGTSPLLDDEAFVRQLRQSFIYWLDKTMAGGDPPPGLLNDLPPEA